MIDDERIIELFFERSEEAIQELGNTAKPATSSHTTS